MLFKLLETGHTEDSDLEMVRALVSISRTHQYNVLIMSCVLLQIVGAAKIRGCRCTIEDAKAWIAAHTSGPQRASLSMVANSVGDPGDMSAKLRLRIGYNGLPVDSKTALIPTDYTQDFYVVVADDFADRPRSVTIWSLGRTDTKITAQILRGCRAIPCQASENRPPGAFKIELGICSSFYCVPLSNQLTGELVDFFNECGREDRALERRHDGTAVPGLSSITSVASYASSEPIVRTPRAFEVCQDIGRCAHRRLSSAALTGTLCVQRSTCSENSQPISRSESGNHQHLDIRRRG